MINVLLLDGYNLLYRAFTSLPAAIVGADGQPINAVYGMISATLRLARELDAERVAVAFDVPEVPTFRHKLYPSYQGQRGPLGGEQWEEFARQVAVAQALLPRLGAPALTAPGYEADDVMATLATQVAADGGEAAIVSTDRDLLQLVRPGIEIVTPGKILQRSREAQDVLDRMGVPPAGVPPFKALAGDASDNIPGVRGIGGKTAADLVNRFAGLDAIYAELPSLPPRVASALASQREEAYLFLDIVTLRTELTLPVAPGDLPPHAFQADARVRELLER